MQAWHTTKLALFSCVLYVPIAVGMIAIGYSSNKHKERNLHGGIPVLISGIAFMCASPKCDCTPGLDTITVCCVMPVACSSVIVGREAA